MTSTVLIMIIIGVIFIVVSFFLTEKLSKKEENFNIDLLTVNDNYELSDRERNIVREKIEDEISEQAKDILYETNESLSNMANEKMMALGDYAVAVCDQIEKNHKEVMFLYSMLDDKKKEIMNTVETVNEVNSEVKETMEVTSKKNNKKKTARKTNKTATQLTPLKEMQKDLPEVFEEKDVVNDEVTEKKGYTKNSAQAVTENKENEIQLQTEKKDESTKSTLSENVQTDLAENVLEENANDMILDLYKNGESVIDIAKQLGLGVGEVKLVIDLYQGE